jgi:hypothetical protein
VGSWISINVLGEHAISIFRVEEVEPEDETEGLSVTLLHIYCTIPGFPEECNFKLMYHVCLFLDIVEEKLSSKILTL